MDTEEIEQTLKEQASKLAKGDDIQKAFGERLRSLASEVEKYRKDSREPFTEEKLKQSVVKESKSKRRVFQPRHLKPEQQRMYRRR